MTKHPLPKGNFITLVEEVTDFDAKEGMPDHVADAAESEDGCTDKPKFVTDRNGF